MSSLNVAAGTGGWRAALSWKGGMWYVLTYLLYGIHPATLHDVDTARLVARVEPTIVAMVLGNIQTNTVS